MVVALVVAGSLLMWGYSFANSRDTVHNDDLMVHSEETNGHGNSIKEPVSV